MLPLATTVLPLISIIMAASPVEESGSARWPMLRGALASIRRGGCDDYEVLVGSDGHSPEIQAICAEDPRAKYFAFPRHGYGGGYQRNGLLACATGRLIYAIDDDDRLRDGALAIIGQAYLDYPLHPHWFRIEARDNGERLWPDGQREGQIAHGCCGTPMLAVANRPEHLGRWGMGRAADWGFIASTLSRGWPPSIWHEDVVAYYRRGTDRADWGDS